MTTKHTILVSFASVIYCVGDLVAGPTFMYPKNVEPKITSLKRESGLTLGRKEWISPTIHTVVFEVSSGTNQILLVVNQRAFGLERIFYHLASSGHQTTIEPPTKKEDPVLFRIEKAGIFLDGFRFTVDRELEPYPPEWMEKIREEEKTPKPLPAAPR